MNSQPTCLCGKHNLDDGGQFQFLLQSNYIENERTLEALEDAHNAWLYALALNKISVSDVLEIHRLLMERINPKIAGTIRKVNVTVGERICPNPGQVRRMLYQFIESYNVDYSNLDTPFMEDTAKALHVEFEKIHPFEDGNGRVGRILYNWQRVKNHLPIHVIHEGEEQTEYYKWFK